MRTRLVKWLCVIVLLIAFVLWRSIAGYDLPLRLLVCSGAAVVAVQAFHSAGNRWTMCFLSIALLFNPAIPVFPLANRLGLVAIVLAGAAFAVSLTKVKSQPLLSPSQIVTQASSRCDTKTGSSTSIESWQPPVREHGSALCRSHTCGTERRRWDQDLHPRRSRTF